MDISIRTMTAADLDSAAHILNLAFHTEDDRNLDLVRFMAVQPDGLFVASAGDRLVGVVSALDYGPFAYIGHMAIHPDAQRRGIGRRMMQHVLSWLDGRGCPLSLLDASDAGAPLYATLGFAQIDQAHQYKRQALTRCKFPGERVKPLTVQDLEAVARFDTPIFGADRSAVLRAYLSDLPGRAFVVRDDAGAVSGYVIAQMRKIGPWVAAPPQDAELLWQAAMSLDYDGAPTVIVPGANPEAVELITRYGFQWQRSLPHMHMQRGEAIIKRNRALVYGQLSFALG